MSSELSPRLAAIAGLVPQGAVVADIGTDHARLPLHLVSSGLSPRVIATDLNEKPYQGACRQIQAAGAGGRVEVRKGDGLEAIEPGEVEVVVIAGMGAATIQGILERSQGVLSGVKRLVLQPMSDVADLRNWLAGNGWRLVDEELVKEDEKFYVILAAEPGEQLYEDGFLLEVGPVLVNKCTPVLVEYLEKLKGDYQRVLAGLARSRADEAMEKAIGLTSRLNRLREVICRCRQRSG